MSNESEIDWGKQIVMLITAIALTLSVACYLARYWGLTAASAIIIWFWVFVFPAVYVIWNELKKVGEP